MKIGYIGLGKILSALRSEFGGHEVEEKTV